MTSDEKNRKISEHLEEWRWIHVCDSICAYGCTHTNTLPEPRAWDADENASALLLERMPHPYLVKLGDEWECAADDWYRQGAYIFAGDRKTAIRDAYLAMIEGEK